MTDAPEIVKLIVRSQRIFDDALAHLHHTLRGGLALAPMQLHLVPWRDCRQSREMRCFVHQQR